MSKTYELSKGFLLLYDWLPALKQLPDDKAMEFLYALIDRQREGTPLPVFDTEIANTFAQMIEPSIIRRLDGAKGGRKAKENASKDTTPHTTVVPTPHTALPSRAEQSKEKQSKEKQSESDTPPRPPKPPKKKYGEYKNVRLTDREYSKLCNDHPNADEAIEFLSEYIERKGYKAKSHYLTLKKWVFKALKEQEQKNRGNEMEEALSTLNDIRNGTVTSTFFEGYYTKKKEN